MSGGHKQRYPLISSTQVEPKAHGEDWHSLISVRGKVKVKICLLYGIKGSTTRQQPNTGSNSQHANQIHRLNFHSKYTSTPINREKAEIRPGLFFAPCSFIKSSIISRYAGVKGWNEKECGHLKAFKRENNLCNQCQRARLINCWPAKLVFPQDSGRARCSDTKNGPVWPAAQYKDNWLARTSICI